MATIARTISTTLRPHPTGTAMPIPLEMCTRLSAGVLRSVKEFRGEVFRAAFVCCQKQDDRAFFSLSQRRNSVASRSRPLICRAGLLFAQNGSMTGNQTYSQIPAKTRCAALPICQSKTRGVSGAVLRNGASLQRTSHSGLSLGRLHRRLGG
jgi:hypothetical protein